MRKTYFYLALTLIVCLASFLLGMSVTETETVASRQPRILWNDANADTAGERVYSALAPVEDYYTREGVNGKVADLLHENQNQRVLDIYGYLSQDREVTQEVIDSALRYDIPVNLLFALINIESSFRTDLVAKNPNGTSDYGIMQCNSRTFSNFDREELLDFRTNMKLGCEYLIKMKKTHDTWEMAVYRYNGIGSRAVKHMAKVINQEREIDRVVNRYL
jgi:soluble lytic murein transglycosylase-like protein